MKRRMIAVAGAAILVALVLNVAGVLRYPGGPVREPNADGVLWLDLRPADQSNSVSNTAEADWATTDTDLIFSMIDLANPGPWPATVESVSPVGVSGGLVTSQVLVTRSDVRPSDVIRAYGPVTATQRAILSRDYEPLPVVLQPGAASRNVALIVRASNPGPAGFDAVAVDYRMGPLSFRAVYHLSLRACLGATRAQRSCPAND